MAAAEPPAEPPPSQAPLGSSQEEDDDDVWKIAQLDEFGSQPASLLASINLEYSPAHSTLYKVGRVPVSRWLTDSSVICRSSVTSMPDCL